MRIRTEFFPFTLMNQDSVTLNVNAWRASIYILSDSSKGGIINGIAVPFLTNLITFSADNNPTCFVVGGAVVGGRPVMIDQAFTFVSCSGGVVLEYIDE